MIHSYEGLLSAAFQTLQHKMLYFQFGSFFADQPREKYVLF